MVIQLRFTRFSVIEISSLEKRRNYPVRTNQFSSLTVISPSQIWTRGRQDLMKTFIKLSSLRQYNDATSNPAYLPDKTHTARPELSVELTIYCYLVMSNFTKY